MLAVVSNQDTRLRINLDGTNLTFGEAHSVKRMALFSADFATLYTDYIVPKIPGTPVAAKVITAMPGPPVPDTTVDSASVSGEAAPTNGTNEDYTVTATGDATPYTYTWSVTGTGSTIASGQGTATATVTWGDAGAGSVTCEVGSTNANFDGTTQR